MDVATEQILIIGANGQAGQALQKLFPDAKAVDKDELDITSREIIQSFDWSGVKVIINSAAYTDVDGAETEDGSKLARAINDQAVGYLADLAQQNDMLLVHISTAYVFDGKKKIYSEDDTPNPLGIYAKTKLAGEQKAQSTPRHYILRTDSLIGEGKNFVRTMLGLAEKKIAPAVVADQIIRPTFASELAGAIKFLIENQAPYGIYNLTNEGEPLSWADFTRVIFKEAGVDLVVTDTSLDEYAASKPGVAPRPKNSVLDLSKIEALGFKPQNWRKSLANYVKAELSP